VAPGVRRRNAEERRRHRVERLQAHFDRARTIQLDLHRVVLRQPSLFIGRPLDTAELNAAAHVLGCQLRWGERRSDAVVVVSDQPLGPGQARDGARVLHARRLVHYARADFEGTLAGLLDRRGDTLGLGRSEDVDFLNRILTVNTVVDPADIVLVMLGREKYPK
jgi:polynucleotide 5'-kinase involved in rRNA processing